MTELTDKEYLHEFTKKAVQFRIPLAGSINLTNHCNLRCIHCYIGSQRDIYKRLKNEMTTKQILHIIDEITKAGCLNLLLTGGEPLLRKDFSKIYIHAKTNGLLVTVFTNGTLISNDIIDLFEDLPPQIVEISLYGSTATTYEKITRIKGSYKRCLLGINSLLKHKINVRLKTILMTLNNHEFYDIEHMAKEFGVKFRFDAAIFPRFNGDKKPLSLRVSPEEAVDKELSNHERLHHWKVFFERFKGNNMSETLYNCGAGLTNFYIDPYGNLMPCLMVTNPKYNLLNGNFSTGWQDVISRIREKKPINGFPCTHCTQKILCGYCPAFFKLENNSEYKISHYLCSIGHKRFQYIKDINLEKEI